MPDNWMEVSLGAVAGALAMASLIYCAAQLTPLFRFQALLKIRTAQYDSLLRRHDDSREWSMGMMRRLLVRLSEYGDKEATMALRYLDDTDEQHHGRTN